MPLYSAGETEGGVATRPATVLVLGTHGHQFAAAAVVSTVLLVGLLLASSLFVAVL
jgi:hypothetical protein